MLQELRSKTKWIMVIVALAFVGLMVFEWGMDISGRSAGLQAGELGRVNGTPVNYQAYMNAYNELFQQVQVQTGEQPSREQVRQIEEMAWQQVVNNILIEHELRRRGIRVTDAEIRQAARYSPHPELMRNELFMTDGQFDLAKYQQFLASPAANEQLLLQLEQYYREMIPRTKLMRQVTAGLYLSDAELWRSWRDRNETARVEYVALDVARLVPGEVEVTEREVRGHYDQNRQQFRRQASARLALAYLPKAASAEDSVAALQRAQSVRAEIGGGADFAEVAQRESADPGSRQDGGDLGTFTRGQMVPAFDQAVFSLPIGQISEPVLTQFGYHLIQVQERADNQARARHVLIPIERTEEALDRLYTRADSLEALAERAGLERAARVTGATVREGVMISEADPFVPGVGTTLDALEWALDEAGAGTTDAVSPLFETDEAFYIARIESVAPAGEIPFAEAAPQIRRQLVTERKREQAREIGQQMVAQVRAGRSLQEVAEERGLSVAAAGPFTRMDFNPVFGQTNAAVGAAFGVPVGQVSDVVQTTGGLFIIRPLERTEADRAAWEEQKEQQRMMEMFRLQQEQVTRWLESLRREAEIVDSRSEVLQRRV